MKKAATFLSLVLLGGGVTLLSGYFAGNIPLNSGKSSSLNSSTALAQNLPAANPLLNGNTNFITQVVDKVGPAVVRIDSSRTVTSKIPDAFNNPLFRQFFGSNFLLDPNSELKKVRGRVLLSAATVRFSPMLTLLMEPIR